MRLHVSALLPVLTLSGLAVADCQQPPSSGGGSWGSSSRDQPNPGKSAAGPTHAYDVAPKLRHSVEAEFSVLARRKIHESGIRNFDDICLIALTVDENGKTQNPWVIRSAPYDLDQQALLAVEQYLFYPALKNGKPVAVQITVEIQFRLHQ